MDSRLRDSSTLLFWCCTSFSSFMSSLAFGSCLASSGIQMVAHGSYLLVSRRLHSKVRIVTMSSSSRSLRYTFAQSTSLWLPWRPWAMEISGVWQTMNCYFKWALNSSVSLFSRCWWVLLITYWFKNRKCKISSMKRLINWRPGFVN